MALSLTSVNAVIARFGQAKNIALGAYFLEPDGPMQRALLAAARSGKHVTVTLQRNPYRDDEHATGNAACAQALRRAGAHVTLLDREQTRFHLKAAVCDGVAYLDDVNWTARGEDLVVADDAPADVALVRAAITHQTGGWNDRLALRKDVALDREIALIRHAGRKPVTVETEYADRWKLTDALREHARSGAPTTLILGSWRHSDGRDRRTLAALRADGVDVRETGRNQKLALAGERAWLGSANATGAFTEGGGQIEWGLVTRKPSLVAEVKDVLASEGAPELVRGRRR